MNLLAIILIFTAVLYRSTQAETCADCAQTGHYVDANGYRCFTLSATDVICTCPGGTRYVKNKPCRLCDPTDPTTPPVCNKAHPKFIACLDHGDYGTAYGCLCEDPSGNPYVTTDANCDPAGTLTTSAAAGTTPSTASICQNGGVSVNGVCHCPSGYGGPICGTLDQKALCERITCKNNGVCAIRNPNGPFEAVCLCRYGTYGDYCELTGTLGSCPANHCSPNGACVENIVGSTRHAYCRCQPGYSGTKCETQHFPCTKAGNFVDTLMVDQGKYFTCTSNGPSFKIEQKSCAKGLRFYERSNQCAY